MSRLEKQGRNGLSRHNIYSSHLELISNTQEAAKARLRARCVKRLKFVENGNKFTDVHIIIGELF